MKHLLCLTALIALTTSLLAVPKYPFPQNVKYAFGIKPANIDNAKVQKAFEDFMKLYKESDDKTMARIQHDTPENTVSEGIGYGMMILVYMDNETNNTQAKFDKLWKYYNNFLDPKGLMNWKIVGFTGPPSGFDGKNSATDADLDVAFSLMEAYKQWGDEKYLSDAKVIIEKISKYDVTSDGYLNPGDSWGVDPQSYNPSYFSTAALEVFKQASTFDWSKVITNSYALTKKASNSTTGLIRDWCTKDGLKDAMHNTSDQYSYDATRTPWRFAWAYCWYGHQDAKDICSKLTSWITQNTSGDPTKIFNGYNITGAATVDYYNSTFVGPFGCAGMVDSTHQAWVDKCYETLPAIPETVYYQISMKILTMLLMSGNMPDLWTTTAVEPTIDRKQTAAHPLSVSIATNAASGLCFSTATSGRVAISFHTVSGRLAAMQVDGFFLAGEHHVACETALPNGTYIVRMSTPNAESTKLVTLTR